MWNATCLTGANLSRPTRSPGKSSPPWAAPAGGAYLIFQHVPGPRSAAPSDSVVVVLPPKRHRSCHTVPWKSARRSPLPICAVCGRPEAASICARSLRLREAGAEAQGPTGLSGERITEAFVVSRPSRRNAARSALRARRSGGPGR